MGAAWLGGVGGGAGGGYGHGSHSGGSSGRWCRPWTARLVSVQVGRRGSARGERMEAAARTAGRCAAGGRAKSREGAVASIHEHMFIYGSARGDAARGSSAALGGDTGGAIGPPEAPAGRNQIQAIEKPPGIRANVSGGFVYFKSSGIFE